MEVRRRRRRWWWRLGYHGWYDTEMSGFFHASWVIREHSQFPLHRAPTAIWNEGLSKSFKTPCCSITLPRACICDFQSHAACVLLLYSKIFHIYIICHSDELSRQPTASLISEQSFTTHTCILQNSVLDEEHSGQA